MYSTVLMDGKDADRVYTYTLLDSALVGATDASGKSIFAGKKATGFSNAEEEAVGKVKV